MTKMSVNLLDNLPKALAKDEQKSELLTQKKNLQDQRKFYMFVNTKF